MPNENSDETFLDFLHHCDTKKTKQIGVSNNHNKAPYSVSTNLLGMTITFSCPCRMQYITFFVGICRIGYLSGARQQFLHAWSVFQEETSFSRDDSRLQFWSGFAINQSVRLESNQVR